MIWSTISASGSRFWATTVEEFVKIYCHMLLCTICTASSMRMTLPRRLVGRSVSTRDRARARAGSNPAVCNFHPIFSHLSDLYWFLTDSVMQQLRTRWIQWISDEIWLTVDTTYKFTYKIHYIQIYIVVAWLLHRSSKNSLRHDFGTGNIMFIYKPRGAYNRHVTVVPVVRSAHNVDLDLPGLWIPVDLFRVTSTDKSIYPGPNPFQPPPK